MFEFEMAMGEVGIEDVGGIGGGIGVGICNDVRVAFCCLFLKRW